METKLPEDFKEFLKLLNANDVAYLLVGGYAVGYHGYPRTTADMDIFRNAGIEIPGTVCRRCATKNGFVGPSPWVETRGYACARRFATQGFRHIRPDETQLKLPNPNRGDTVTTVFRRVATPDA